MKYDTTTSPLPSSSFYQIPALVMTMQPTHTPNLSAHTSTPLSSTASQLKDNALLDTFLSQ